MTNREIKFRAFIKIDEGCMVYEESKEPFLMVSNGNGFGIVSDLETYLKEEEFVIMQYIGLQDSVGKDIYEGDIIHSIFSDGRPCNHIIEWDKETATFMVRFITIEPKGLGELSTISNTWIKEHKKIVIGNVYQNTELFK